MVSSLFETGIGLAAAIACAATLPDVPGGPRRSVPTAWRPPALLEHDLLARPLVLEGGRIRAPFDDGAGGLGIVVDEAALERYGVDDA